MPEQEFKQRYAHILSEFTKTSEEKYLAEAADLGRALVSAEVPLEDLAEIHEAALCDLATAFPDRTLIESVQQISAPLVEMLMSYGQAFRVYHEERKHAEDTRLRLATVIEQAAESVVMTDLEGSIRYVNPACEALTGYSKEELLGRNPRCWQSGQHDVAFYQELWRTLLRGEVWRGHFVNKKKDGSLFEEEATISPVRGANGEIVQYIALKRDVTQEVELNQQLLQAQKLEAVGQLAGGVAHDFNNILQIIGVNTEFILDMAEPNSAINEPINTIMDAVEQATGVTRSLLTFSRKVRAEKLPVDLCSAVDQSVKMLRRTLPAMIEIVVETDCKPAPWVDADPTQLQQLLLNLSVNARDAMPEGGTLRISVFPAAVSAPSQTSIETDAPFARLVVSDNGTGMPPEVQERIFEPFFTTKERGQGTGLGMAIIHSIVVDHNGRIAVESEVGVGTTLTIHLPCISPPDQVADENRHEAVVVPRGHGETLLLAEDDQQIRSTIAATLVSLGYHVLQAADGHTILETFGRHGEGIELLILDVDLPKQSGLACLQTIRTQGYRTPAIIITGSPDAKLDDEICEHTILLPKPFAMNKLGTLVAAQLQQTAAR